MVVTSEMIAMMIVLVLFRDLIVQPYIAMVQDQFITWISLN